jgi:selenoprotein W-related protein
MDAFDDRFSALKLIPSDGGRFEVTLNGELIYSKLETGDFPENKEILQRIRARM